jgi:hypothetical protein
VRIDKTVRIEILQNVISTGRAPPTSETKQAQCVSNKPEGTFGFVPRKVIDMSQLSRKVDGNVIMHFMNTARKKKSTFTCDLYSGQAGVFTRSTFI